MNPLEFIEAMKEQALQSGHAPGAIIAELKQVITTGFAFPITSSTTRQRERLGLEQVKLNEGLAIIAEKTGLLELLSKLEEEQG